jgi:hypothetical protein
MGGWVAVALPLVYPLPWRLMTYAHVDLGTMLFATAGVLCLVRAEDERSARWLYVAAIFAGLAATTKLTGVWVVFAMAGVLLLSSRESWIVGLKRATLFVAVGLLPVLPWLAKTWILTGNPIYPIFHSALGGIEYSSEGWARFQRCHLLFNTLPGMTPTQSNITLAHALIAGMGLLLALVTFRFTRNSPLSTPLRFGALFTAAVCFGSYFSVRFIMAALPPLAAYLGFQLRQWEGRLAPTLCVISLLLATKIGITTVEPDFSTAWGVATGRLTADQYLSAKVPDYEIAQFANLSLQPNDRVLVSTWEKDTTHYRNMAMWSDYWLQDSIHYDSKERLDDDLRRLGITHLVFSPIDDDWCRKSYVCQGRRDAESPALTQLAKSRGRLLQQTGKVSLYALDMADNKGRAPHREPPNDQR